MNELKWQSPARYSRAKGRVMRGAKKPWNPMLVGVLIAVGLYAIVKISTLIRGTPSKIPPWGEVAICVAVGGIYAGFVPFVMSRTSSQVWTNERGLHIKDVVVNHVQVQSFPWEDLTSFRVRSANYDGESFPELVVRTRGIAVLWIGLDGNVSESEIEGLFTSRGLRKDRNVGRGVVPLCVGATES